MCCLQISTPTSPLQITFSVIFLLSPVIPFPSIYLVFPLIGGRMFFKNYPDQCILEVNPGPCSSTRSFDGSSHIIGFYPVVAHVL